MRRAQRPLVALLVVSSLLLLTGLADAKKKKKKKAKTAADKVNAKLSKLVLGDAAKIPLMAEVADAFTPSEGEAWSLERDGSNELEPYAVGTTNLVEALELREEEPQLWRDLSEWVSNALEGDADAKAQLKRVFERWAELNELLVGSQKEAMAATGALTWMAGLGGEALACLPIGACDAADAWIAVRQLGEACSQGGKWQQTLDAHDLQVKIREYLHELADRMSQLYDLDFRVRPEGVAERMKEKEQAAAKAREAAMHGRGGGEEEVDAGALDKDWADLTPTELAAATALGYTEASFLDTAPPVKKGWGALSEAEQGHATLLGWEEELWENELEAALDEL